MVARICSTADLATQADALRAQAVQQSERDEKAFDGVMQSRGEARQLALGEAAAAPLDGMRISVQALHLCANALALGNANLVSDVGSAAEFAHAGMLASAYNVRVNHKFMRDQQKVREQRTLLEQIEREGTGLIASLRRAVNESLQKG